mmetsp:Transcript_18781/g.27137  ORF Transcript_18781/g.27137 Transcript_18781/m.27137 type:complete len:118 (-) Transcript_18781:62-415(-)
MKSITDRGCVVTFDNDEVVIRNKIQLGEESSAALEEQGFDDQRILWHKRLGHVNYDKLTESDRRGLVDGINLHAIETHEKELQDSTPVIMNLDNNPKERGVLSADTMEVLNTPSMEG